MKGLDVSDVRFFSGSSHPQLAADIAGYLSVPVDVTTVGRFSNVAGASILCNLCPRR